MPDKPAPKTMYFDDDGRPVLQPSFCLFIDILGYTQQIQHAFAEGHGAEAFEQYYTSVAAKIRNLIIPDPKFDSKFSPRAWDAKVFTDNIVLGYALWSDHGENELGNAVLQAAHYQLQLALDGFFARGGMAIGELFMDELTVFGPALLDAYNIEHSVADVPRIALSRDVVALAKRYTEFYASPHESPENQTILIDADGVGFLNYLDDLIHSDVDGIMVLADYVAQHRDNIQRRLADFRNRSKIWSKYHWLASYHNWFCDQVQDVPGFADDLRIPVDELYTQPRFLVSDLPTPKRDDA